MAQGKRTLGKIAEEFMPGWKAVRRDGAEDAPHAAADATLSSLAELKHKYFGGTATAADDPSEITLLPLSGLINMAPVRLQDASAGPKAQVFHEGKHTGSQG